MARAPEGDPFDPGDDRAALAPLARAALWGGLAALAVFVAVVAARTETGGKRIAAALNSLPVRPPVTAPAGEVANDLSAAIRALKAERDRLSARVEALERRPEVTGSLPSAPGETHRGAPEGAR